ncbi:MAG: hypothetical protein Q8M76_06560, partial [Spirochaetaceae bacterium]|nr:hypothetical protein [Spirochaetaceae bacterium]
MADSSSRSETEALAAALPGMGGEALALAARYSSETFVRGGRALYYQGDEGSSAYLILAGRIRPLRIKGGSSIPLDEATRGSWLGLTEAYLGVPY